MIYPDETGGQWRVQAVPVSPESFESRKALPEAWRGLRDDELSKTSGVDGCVFIHASGFIGGACNATTSKGQWLSGPIIRKQDKRWSAAVS